MFINEHFDEAFEIVLIAAGCFNSKSDWQQKLLFECLSTSIMYCNTARLKVLSESGIDFNVFGTTMSDEYGFILGELLLTMCYGENTSPFSISDQNHKILETLVENECSVKNISPEQKVNLELEDQGETICNFVLSFEAKICGTPKSLFSLCKQNLRNYLSTCHPHSNLFVTVQSLKNFA